MTIAQTPAPTEDELFYRQALHRIYVNILWLAAAGTIATAWRVGPGWAAGFLAGAVVSAINFRWLQRLVDSVGPDPEKKPGGKIGFVLSFRYVILGVVGYVIVRFFKVDIMAALVGLFVAVAAVMVEILYELIYART